MSNFEDLLPRILSALVLAVLGLGAVVYGGLSFLIFSAAIGGIMVWELARMVQVAPQISVLVGLFSGLAIYGQGAGFLPYGPIFLAFGPVIGAVLASRDRPLMLLYGLAIVAAVVTLFEIRDNAGLVWTLWLILVVIASDVGGYFFGRILGGPKILPVISPKKTWSGTIGGWLLAALIGWAMMGLLSMDAMILFYSILAAIAGQAGDIVESRIKRHVGVKDSSNLIPGHGGFLDRFDALLGAALFFLLLTSLLGAF